MFIMFNHQTNIRMAWQTSRQWYNNVHATSKQPQTKHKFIRISGQDLTTGYHLHQHLNMSKNQSAQNLKLTMAIASVSIRQQEYSIKSHQINASMANRAEIYLYIKKKSRFLHHKTIILNDTSCIETSIQRPFINISWQGKWLRSNHLLVFEEKWKQCCSGGCSSKQKFTMPWDDENLRLLGSAVLRTLQISFHHGWMLEKKQNKERAVQMMIDDSKCFTRLTKWWRKES